jgi:hypothetical protein
VLFSTGRQGFIAIEAAIGERKDRHGDGGHIGNLAKFCLSKKEQSLLHQWLCKHQVQKMDTHGVWGSRAKLT